MAETGTGIGAAVKRKEDARFITGVGRYTDDINQSGQAYAVFLRSPHARATTGGIDTSAALQVPGREASRRLCRARAVAQARRLSVPYGRRSPRSPATPHLYDYGRIF